MKKFLFAASVCAIALASCNKDNLAPQADFKAGLPAKPQAHVPVDVNGLITKSFLSKDTVWLIDGVSFVAPGQTLTIEAGTFLTSGNVKSYNDEVYGAQNIRGVLVVPKTAKLNAIGTAAAPIVFTSPNASGSRNPGDFGGVIMLGNATTNQPATTRIEGVPAPIGVDVTYGGSNPADNSGTLKYVRIEFAGYNLTENNEINGLTLGGVGSGTTLENIQVSWGKDDGFEFFGGTVNAKYLVASSNDDDDFDFDFGYTGTIQYALSLKDPNATNSVSGGNSDSNGLESDNNGAGDASRLPLTNPKLRNFTFLGIKDAAVAATKLKYGNRWRRASSLDIESSIIAGYATGASFESISGGNFSNNVVHGYAAAFNGSAPGSGNSTTVSSDATSYLALAGGTNIFYPVSGGFNPFVLRPTATSPAYGTGTSYKGAIDPAVTNPSQVWTFGWTQFSPKTY
ncbi:hypothetical protein ACR78F_20300 [Sphingobacterium spiritivorum]|uniref:hypothetical protein n=1 Tax=Sphingobacterium spiritivorum TaxID=258 RepID=UPI003DA628BB